MQKTNDYRCAFGNELFSVRKKIGITQEQLSEKLNVNVRTIQKIEHFEANPTLQTVYALIRGLKIDPYRCFYPEVQNETSSIQEMMLLLSDCTEDEIASLIPVVSTILSVMRSEKFKKIE